MKIEYNQELQEFIEKHSMTAADIEAFRKREESENNRSGIRALKGTVWWKLLKPARWLYNVMKLLRFHIRRYGVILTLVKVKDKLISRRKLKRFSRRYIKAILPDEEEMARERAVIFDRDIKFSILVPLYNTPEQYLREMIDSVIAQTYENWELCLADGSDAEHAYVEQICKEYKEPRIVYQRLEKNLGISGNTNVCIEMSTGEYICLFDHDDILHPSVLYENMKMICKEGADFLYTDEATFNGDDLYDIITYHFKPDFAIDNLRANNYICHFTTFSRELFSRTGMFDSDYDGSQDHDLILRLTAVADKICHIPKLLYFWRSHPNSVAADINSKTYAIQAGMNAVKNSITRDGLEVEVESSPAFPTIYRFRYVLKEKPLISIIIPNKDHVSYLIRAVDSILKKSTYENYEIIIVENNSTEEETFAFYKLIETLPCVRVVTWDKPFNYSAINNYGAGFAGGEYLLLLNNDVEIISESWMEEMLMYAQREDVGAVGAKLYFGNRSIQHMGVIIGIGEDGIAVHSHLGEPFNSVGYMGRLYFAQDVSAVTAACLMVKHSLYDAAGGFEEKLTVAYNDVDFCLKLRELGLLNICTPYAELFHYESISRGYENNSEKRERFQSEVAFMKQKWKTVLEQGDPYYNPNMSKRRPWKLY